MSRPKATPAMKARARRKARANAKRWYRKNRRTAKAKRLANWHAKPHASRASNPTEKRFAADIGGHITVAKNLDHPFLRWMDAGGTLHEEKELSAGELIQAWEKAQRRRKKKNA